MPLKAIFFDLDDTLFDCFGQLVHTAHREAVRAMIEAGMEAEEEEAYLRRLAIHEATPEVDLDAELAKSYGASEAAEKAGRKAYFSRNIGPIEAFEGVEEMLQELRELKYRLFLVTRGDVSTQARKLERLGLKKYFSETAYVDMDSESNKKKAFFHLMNRYSLEPGECIVVGDRVSGEIRDGREIGMVTVRLRGGEFGHVEPGCNEERADHEIEDILELMEVLKGLY